MPHPGYGSPHEDQHGPRASGNDLRAGVLGANDGLVSNFCLLMGVAGGGLGGKAILLTGVAGLLAGSFSMALGEWLSVTNAREMTLTLLGEEAAELKHQPEKEFAELLQIYKDRGYEEADARTLATLVMKNHDLALDVMAREELGIDPAEMGGHPWRAAAVSFGLFAAGAVVPLAPFVLMTGAPAILGSLWLSILGLMGLGLATARFNGRSPLYSGIRQVLIGAVAAAATYGMGRFFGAELS